MGKKSKNKFYVVKKGHRTGIFDNWSDCEKSIVGYSRAIYKGFKTYEEAITADNLTEEEFKDRHWGNNQLDTNQDVRFNASKSVDNIIFESICVDASCIANPGIVEWRGVDTKNKEELFRPSPKTNGTNNIGEFLAIVHGLAYLKKQNKSIPIYSDSQTAISWVKNKKTRSKLQQASDNKEIFELIDRAEKWLHENIYENPILKWDTASWGEIPADFGRK